MFRKSTAPKEREQNVPIKHVAAVTIMAPYFLDMRSSSEKKAVLTSWSEINEVSAANDNSV